MYIGGWCESLATLITRTRTMLASFAILPALCFFRVWPWWSQHFERALCVVARLANRDWRSEEVTQLMDGFPQALQRITRAAHAARCLHARSNPLS